MSSSSPAAAGPVQQLIEAKLGTEFSPTYMTVMNESYMHSVPKGSESHFKVVIVSDAFGAMKGRVARHRAVNELLKDELAGPIHALSLTLKTSAEWEKSKGKVAKSPGCMGGSKADMK